VTTVLDSDLPDLSRPFPIEDETKSAFRHEGHAVIRELASPEEVAAFRPRIVEAALRLNEETRPLEERDVYGKAFLQAWNLWEHDDEVRRFTFSRRFARVAAELMGVSGVRIYHDQALFKEPGGGPTPLHQDQHYWPLDTANTVTMWMPLSPISAEVGSMTFISGSHRLGYLGESGISEAEEQAVEDKIQSLGLMRRTYGAMAPGDATFHAGWTLHSAPPNPSGAMREVMTVIYVAADAGVTKPAPHQVYDMEMWMPGLKPGDLLASRRNPLVWSAEAT